MSEPSRGTPTFATLFWHAALVPLSAATCVFALVLLPHRVGHLLSTALAVAGGPRDARHAPFAAGATACSLAMALLLACGVGRAAAPALAPSATAVVTALLALLAPASLGAVLAPFLLAPLALLDGAEGLVESVVRSFELSARRGALRTMQVGAVLGAQVGVASVLVAGIDLDEPSLAHAVTVLAMLALLGSPGAAFLLARAYVDAKARPAFREVADARVTRSLRHVALLVLPAAFAVALALVVALLTPAPMTPVRRGMGVDGTWGAPLEPARPARDTIAIPGAHGLVVRALEHGVSIETADGGGAGVVPLPRWSSEGDVVAFTVHPTGDRWAVVRNQHFTVIDDEGVRLDDSFADRWSARVGRQTLALFVLALALAAWWQRRMGRTLVDAAALDAPEARRDVALDRALVRVPGRLSVDEGSVVATEGLSARVQGSARFVSGDGEIVVALPSEVALVLPHDGPAILDGREVALLARGDSLARVGLRQGSIPWPDGARLLAGERADAAEILLTRAARSSSLAALAIAVALASAALAIVTNL